MKRLVIDFDGTCCEHKFPEIGEPIKGIKEAFISLKKEGYYISIHSCRLSKEVVSSQYDRKEHYKMMKQFFEKNEIPYDEIIEYCDKPLATYYIDDRAIRFRGDWKNTINELKELENE